MIKSMTGFGCRECKITTFGKICVELRSGNHKFFDIAFRLPDGFLSLEEKLKKEIESKIKRGRITCSVSISGERASHVSINKALLKNYITALNEIKKEYRVNDGLNIDMLIRLPGVLVLEENKIPSLSLWPQLKPLFGRALDDLEETRKKEGKVLYGHLKDKVIELLEDLSVIRLRFKEASQKKLDTIKTNEERSAFLRDSDITEEVERLAFHSRNFKSKLSKSGPAGKELDFIAQEMQREANTLGAKSFDVVISSRAVQMKSCIEKIREQVQNIE